MATPNSEKNKAALQNICGFIMQAYLDLLDELELEFKIELELKRQEM